MEPQTLFNVVFALVSLLLFIGLVWARTTSGVVVGLETKSGVTRARESLTSEDDYAGNLDETEAVVTTRAAVETFGSTPTLNEEYAEAATVLGITEPDLLVHHDAADLSIPQFVRLATGYRADLMSAGSVAIERSDAIPDAYSSFKDPYFDNARPQWSSRVAELWSGTDYVAASKAKFRATSDAVCYRSDDPHHSRMYVVRLLRVADRVEFYYVHFTQRYKNSYTDDRSYTAVVEALNTLKRFHSDADYVIAGTFNVHGHEAVFRHHLPEHYAVCDFRNVPTRMDARGRGLASPDGLVVSTRVYEAVEYSTDMSDLNARNGALVLLAALFIKHPHRLEGAHVSDQWPLQNMMDDMAATLDADEDLVKSKGRVHYGQRSAFDPSRHRTDAVMYASVPTATAAAAGAVETRIEATSSNVLFRTEPPVTASRCIGNGIAVRVRPLDENATATTTQRPSSSSSRSDSKAKQKTEETKKSGGSVDTATKQRRAPTSPYGGVIDELAELEKTQRP